MVWGGGEKVKMEAAEDEGGGCQGIKRSRGDTHMNIELY